MHTHIHIYTYTYIHVAAMDGPRRLGASASASLSTKVVRVLTFNKLQDELDDDSEDYMPSSAKRRYVCAYLCIYDYAIFG